MAWKHARPNLSSRGAKRLPARPRPGQAKMRRVQTDGLEARSPKPLITGSQAPACQASPWSSEDETCTDGWLGSTLAQTSHHGEPSACLPGLALVKRR
ncbi:hypothetical protein NDU88_010698 [Pleurodeles waltl]|uniref:Uncharacterized protein n=1 Tax=Pleurodeles waltl TaxID=8319 RepID=A0AAV7S201_PLEWA|nr:hypothetical protein NDU88_010698 [Pleurodeles waltl]